MDIYTPKWHKELSLFIKIKPLIILEGNVLDSYQYPKDGSIVGLTQYLNYFFQDNGYKNVVFFDHLYGFYNDFDANALTTFADMIKVNAEGNYIHSKFTGAGKTAPALISDVFRQNNAPTAVIMDFASRYIVSPDRIEQSANDSFTMLLRAASMTHKNSLVLIVNKINDLPTWFYLNNPCVKVIALEYPTPDERRAFIKNEQIFPTFFSKEIRDTELPQYVNNPEELNKLQDKFVAMTDGLSFKEINSLRLLSKTECRHIKNLCGIIDLYKYGIRENPWNSIDHNKIAAEHFKKRVMGQDAAISKTLDIIKRAITGLAGLQSSSHTKPKGILFFAGPTGTGKTETAKTLTEILFGDESACLRFDMSEYSQSHSDQKLLGAPPGYVGYEAGGQLTNAIKKNPFSILLFDEIEKAHPSIFDKFLQILEDGRMTDGQGNTVYFSETVIIFTSNLGIYTKNQIGERSANVNMNMTYEELSAKVKGAIKDYFKLDLGRPEILNRIGENIVVYDYIRPQIAKNILSAQLDRICQALLTDKNIKVIMSDKAFEVLLAHSLQNLENGGRGIGNIVESMFINPLSRYLFDNNIERDMKIVIKDITLSHGLPSFLVED